MKRTDFIEYYKKSCYPMEVLMKLAPLEDLDWKPREDAWTLAQLLEHSAITPRPLLHLIQNDWPASHSAPPKGKTGPDACTLFKQNKEETLAALEGLSDDDFLNRPASTPFGFEGTLANLLQVMTDHQSGHKTELYMYLKMIGVPVNTATLYMGKTQ